MIVKKHNLRPKSYDPRPTILLGLTTTPGSDWREKVREIDELGLEEVALFPTYLVRDERQELYKLLEKSCLERIVFTHLREEDMPPDEINYLTKQFGCNLFNIHSYRFGINPPVYLEQFKDQIYIENAGNLDMLERIAGQFAGLCIDFAHWEEGNIKGIDFYKSFPKFIKKFKIGFAHISAILEHPKVFPWSENKIPCYAYHTMDQLRDLDYLKKYIDYLPEILGIELENSFKEQLNIKKYLEEMINGK